MPLFGKSHKNPFDLIKSLQEALIAVEKGDKKAEKATEDVSKNLVAMKNLLYGSGDNEPQTDIAVAQLAQELYNSNLLLMLINNLSRIEFEAKKDVAQIFNNILRRQIGELISVFKNDAAINMITLILNPPPQGIAKSNNFSFIPETKMSCNSVAGFLPSLASFYLYLISELILLLLPLI